MRCTHVGPDAEPHRIARILRGLAGVPLHEAERVAILYRDECKRRKGESRTLVAERLFAKLQSEMAWPGNGNDSTIKGERR